MLDGRRYKDRSTMRGMVKNAVCGMRGAGYGVRCWWKMRSQWKTRVCGKCVISGKRGVHIRKKESYTNKAFRCNLLRDLVHNFGTQSLFNKKK